MSKRLTDRRNKLRDERFKKIFTKLFLYFVIVILTLVLGAFVILNKRFWNGADKIALAVRESDGGVGILIFDPIADEIVKVPIPQNTEIDVAKELGVWKIGSLWKFNEQEGIRGELVTKSVTSYFNMPLFLWSDIDALGFYNADLRSLLSAMFLPYKTNLNFTDKIALGLFSFSIENSKRYSLDLEKSGYLTRSILSDGQEGFILNNKDLPSNISVLFSDPVFSENEFRISLIDHGENSRFIESVTKTIDVLGGKVTTVTSDKDSKDFVCIVKSKNTHAATVISYLFSCEIQKKEKADNFDMILELGNKFISEN